MGYFLIALLLVVAIVVTFSIFVRSSRTRSHANREQRLHAAIAEFEASRSRLGEKFLTAAAATGKPRGLRWKAVELSGPPTFAIDAHVRLYALVAATISFEAIEGGGMEDVEAVGNLRSATAVFLHRDHQWTTDGRVIFNLEPAEALDRFDATLQPIGSQSRQTGG